MNDTDTVSLATDRLMLRPPAMDDAAAITGLIDRHVARMTAGAPYPGTVEMTRAFLTRVRQDGTDAHRLFLIESRQAGPAGLLGFHRGEGPLFELGFWLGADFRGRGLASEAVEAAMTWARDDWRRRAVTSGHFVDNPASARVLDRCGFLYTGVVEPQFSLGRDADVDTRLMVWLA